MERRRSFVVGAIFVFIVGAYLLFVASAGEISSHYPNKEVATVIPSDAVTITLLPSFRILSGNKIPFEGKVELRQVIDGHFAQNLVVVNFEAFGEHAEKSIIKIVWENGEIEKVYPGTKDRILLPGKRATEIIIAGYSMNERHIFRDSPRRGSLNWEIRYDPVEI